MAGWGCALSQRVVCLNGPSKHLECKSLESKMQSKVLIQSQWNALRDEVRNRRTIERKLLPLIWHLNKGTGRGTQITVINKLAQDQHEPDLGNAFDEIATNELHLLVNKQRGQLFIGQPSRKRLPGHRRAKRHIRLGRWTRWRHLQTMEFNSQPGECSLSKCL